MNVLAIIPARGGSKGIPNKNIVELGGKPLIAWSIEFSRSSMMVDRTIVSTDSAAIAEVARRYGADVPFMRPAKYAGDLSPDIEVFYHTLTYLKQTEEYTPDIVVNLRPVCPFRLMAEFEKAISIMIENPTYDSLRSMSKVQQIPFKMWKKRQPDDNSVEPILNYFDFPEPYNMPRQLFPDIYYQHGQYDIMRARTILDRQILSGNNVYCFECACPIDIDFPDDLDRAKEILRNKEWKSDI